MNIRSLLIMRQEKFVVAIMSRKRDLYVIISQGIISNRLKSFSKCQYILSMKITFWWLWLNVCAYYTIIGIHQYILLCSLACIGMRYEIYICIYKYSAIFSDLLKHVNIVILRAPLSIVPYQMSRFCAQVLEIALKPFS